MKLASSDRRNAIAAALAFATGRAVGAERFGFWRTSATALMAAVRRNVQENIGFLRTEEQHRPRRGNVSGAVANFVRRPA